MTKKLLTIILSFSLIFVLFPRFVYAESSYANLKEVIENGNLEVTDDKFEFRNLTSHIEVILKGDIVFEGQINILNGRTIRMYLHGHSIDRGLKGSSAAENGSLFNVLSGGELLMDGSEGTITGGNTTKDGGAINVENEGFLYIINTKIVDNKAKNGGAISNAGVATFSQCNISNNHASGLGGAIYNTGELSISGTMENNESVGDGGVIYSSGSAVVNGTYQNNKSTGGNGGVVYNKGNLEFKYTTTNSNSAINGGAIYNASGSRTEITAGTITGCSASNNGGAVYNETHSGDEFKTLTIGTNATIKNCSALNYGGAIYNEGTIGFGDSTIKENKVTDSTGLGGGIYIKSGNTFVGGNIKVTGNTINGIKDNNLYLCGNKQIILGSGSDVPVINTGSRVGISMESPGVFTTGKGTYDLDCFTSDNSEFFVSHNEDQKIQLGKTYSLTFITDYGNPIETQIINPGEKANKPSEPADQEDYYFDNWYTDKNYTDVFDFNTTFDKNIYIYAKWINKENTVKITFNMNGHGTEIDKQFNSKDQTINTLPTPSADGWKFEGWYKDAGCTQAWNLETDVVTNETTLYAKWSKLSQNTEQSSSSSSNSTYTIPKTGIK